MWNQVSNGFPQSVTWMTSASSRHWAWFRANCVGGGGGGDLLPQIPYTRVVFYIAAMWTPDCWSSFVRRLQTAYCTWQDIFLSILEWLHKLICNIVWLSWLQFGIAMATWEFDKREVKEVKSGWQPLLALGRKPQKHSFVPVLHVSPSGTGLETRLQGHRAELELAGGKSQQRISWGLGIRGFWNSCQVLSADWLFSFHSSYHSQPPPGWVF